MCRGVQDWTTQELEEHIAQIEQWLQDPAKYKMTDPYQRLWAARLDQYKEILKERAEEGTYL
jgi:hypothetical protein